MRARNAAIKNVVSSKIKKKDIKWSAATVLAHNTTQQDRNMRQMHANMVLGFLCKLTKGNAAKANAVLSQVVENNEEFSALRTTKINQV